MLTFWQVVGIAVLAVCTKLYFYLKHKYSYWERLGIKGPPPIWGLGNVHQRIVGDLHTQEREWTLKYGKVYGAYMGLTPTLTVNDPELIKQALIKDFQYFTNRIEIQSYHELWNKNLFSANDDQWKRIRMITSPSFSSGKLRLMNSIMNRSVEKLNDHFGRLTTSEPAVMESVKRVLAGFTIDVIASTSFATETNSNEDPNSPFVVNGFRLFDINPLRGAASFLLNKRLLKLLNIETFFSPEPFQFFIDLTSHIVKSRLSGATSARNDLVQLLKDASVNQEDLDRMNYEKMTVGDDDVSKEGATNKASEPVKLADQNGETKTKRKLTDSEIIANCIFFLIAGYETTASTLTNTLFELSHNPDIQEKLRSDLEAKLSHFDDPNSEAYFDTVMNEMPYLEAVVKETLRKYPPVSQMNRVCTKDGYKLGDVTLPKGMVIVFCPPAIQLHPDYYPDPFCFDPTRFMPEKKHLLTPYTYLPFSLGPRNCIAMRFAYQEIKLCLASIIRKYRFDLTQSTPKELTFKKGSGLAVAESFPLQVSRR